MHQDELIETFNQQASDYDELSSRIAPIYHGLYFLLEAIFNLPGDAKVLCVGAGTGKEMVHLARKFPRWRFTAVDPSGAMLEACHSKANEMDFAEPCQFHEGYVDSLPEKEMYDASTCFLVSQFILSKDARCYFFQNIAQKLKPGGILASADLASDVASNDYELLLKQWCFIMTGAACTPDKLEQMKANYNKHVSILAPLTIASIIESGGFERPVQFFQAGLIHGWYSRRKIKLNKAG